MKVLNETADQVFETLMREVGPKAKTSLNRIKEACDKIEQLSGLMNYTRVAAVATELFGSPRLQTVQNNKDLKTYIALRMQEYESRKRGRSGRGKSNGTKPSPPPPYPAEGLDGKTRLFIDCLLQDNRRLEVENKRLSGLLEEETQLRPISLQAAFGKGPTETLGLEVELGAATTTIPDYLRDILKALLAGEIPGVKVQQRGQASRLVTERDGVEHVLLSPAQWKASLDWLDAA